LLIGPLLACVPQHFLPAAKLTAGINLLPDQIGLFRSEEARLRFACHGMRQAVVRTMTRLGVLRTSATRFAALDRALG
jgi:hypothetical protein